MTVTAYKVDLLIDGGIFEAILPRSHKGRWKRRHLIFKSEEYSPDTLDKYHSDFNKRLEITQNVVHALITGQGLLSIATSGHDPPLDLINLVSIRKAGVTVGGCSEGDNSRVF
jgi:hypothetical protein